MVDLADRFCQGPADQTQPEARWSEDGQGYVGWVKTPWNAFAGSMQLSGRG